MAKSKNHTAHNQSYKNHRNGIKKVDALGKGQRRSIKGMDPKFYNKDKADTWLKSIGGEAFLTQRFRALKATRPPSGAPNRINMPVIDAEKNQHIKAATAMGTGKIDVVKQYGK